MKQTRIILLVLLGITVLLAYLPISQFFWPSPPVNEYTNGIPGQIHTQTGKLPQELGFVPMNQTLSYPIVFTQSLNEEQSASNSAVELSLLQESNYDGLDDFAAKMRPPSGKGNMDCFYYSLVPQYSAPDSQWEDRITHINQWISAKPDSITPRLALAEVYENYFWKIRDTTSTNSISSQESQLMEQRLGQATEVLNQAKNLKEKCPGYWSLEMIVALGGGYSRDQLDSIFNEAVSLYPQYFPTYCHRAIFLLWYGTQTEWADDLTKSADKLGGDDGDILYARVAWSIQNYEGNYQNLIHWFNLSWPRLNKGFEDIEKKDPDALDVLSEHAFLAVQAQDISAARRCFAKIAGRVDTNFWTTTDDFERYAHWADSANIQGAAMDGDVELAKLLLKDDPGMVSSKDRQGRTALNLAADHGREAVAALLLANKADINTVDDWARTPLSYAAARDNKDVVELLLANHAAVNVRDTNGYTALLYAVQKDHPDIVQLLLLNKADANIPNNVGWSPLDEAVAQDYSDIATMLLTNNVDINAVDNRGRTPLSLAIAHHNDDVAQLLRQHGGHE